MVPYETPDFEALRPFFRIIEEALDGVTTGGHFFDRLAPDVVVDFVITIPNYPQRITGRENLVELYRGYGDVLFLDSCSDLSVYHDSERGVVVMEYASQGKVVATGAPYANRYVSIAFIEDGKVRRWRDHLDPLKVMAALGSDAPVRR